MRASTRALANLAILLGLIGLVSSVASADAWTSSGPAETVAGDLDDHEASSHDPNDSEAESEDPNDMVVESEDPNDLEVEAEELDDHEQQAEDLADHESRSTALQDLKVEAPDHGFDPIEMPGQKEWTASTDPEVIVARRQLERAQERARDARQRYGDMIRHDYPRGAARVRIVEERDEAERELAAAKQKVRAVHGDVPANRF